MNPPKGRKVINGRCKIGIVTVTLAVLSFIILSGEDVSAIAGEQHAHTLETSTIPTGRLNYLLFLPGGGQWGENLED